MNNWNDKQKEIIKKFETEYFTPKYLLDELYNDMVAILTYFNENNIRYFVLQGTLIGAARNHDLIMWDYDVDIVILDKSVLFKDEFLKLILDLNLKVNKLDLLDIYQFCKSKRLKHSDRCKVPTIDIVVFNKTKKGGLKFNDKEFIKKYKKENPNKVVKSYTSFFKHNEVFPLVKMKIRDFEVYCPNKWKEYLDKDYPGWQDTIYIESVYDETRDSGVRYLSSPIKISTSTDPVYEYLITFRS